jgi:hypothetical protein
MISYIDYVNYLKKNNIVMFDHDYRISYNKLNNEKFVNKYINNQTGGGIISQENLRNIVNLSISSNPQYLFLYL